MRRTRGLSRGRRYGFDLAEIPLFDGLSGRDLAGVESLCTQICVPAGTVLTTEGSGARQMFIISAGQVTVTSGRRAVDTLEGGDLVGEIALIYGGPRTATVRALTDTDVLVFSPREFRALLLHPRVRDRILATANARRRANQLRMAAAGVSTHPHSRTALAERPN